MYTIFVVSRETRREVWIRKSVGKDLSMNTATLDISEARSKLSAMPKLLKDEQVIWITRHNKKAFAVVDTGLMEALLETVDILRDPDALKMLQESIQDIRAGRLIDHKDIESVL